MDFLMRFSGCLGGVAFLGALISLFIERELSQHVWALFGIGIFLLILAWFFHRFAAGDHTVISDYEWEKLKKLTSPEK